MGRKLGRREAVAFQILFCPKERRKLCFMHKSVCVYCATVQVKSCRAWVCGRCSSEDSLVVIDRKPAFFWRTYAIVTPWLRRLYFPRDWNVPVFKVGKSAVVLETIEEQTKKWEAMIRLVERRAKYQKSPRKVGFKRGFKKSDQPLTRTPLFGSLRNGQKRCPTRSGFMGRIIFGNRKRGVEKQ